MERDKSYNGNEPTSFSAHAKRRNDAGPSNSRRQGQGSKKGFEGRGKGRCYNCNKFGHYARESPNKKNPPRDDNNNYKSNNNQRSNMNNNKGKRNAPTSRE